MATCGNILQINGVTVPASPINIIDGIGLAWQNTIAGTIQGNVQFVDTASIDLGVNVSNQLNATVKISSAVGNTLTINGDGLFASGGAGTGITTLNTQTGAVQTFAVGTAGTDFAISSSGNVHTFNIPSASATARGLVTTGSQTMAGAKTFTGGLLLNTVNTITGAAATTIATTTGNLILAPGGGGTVNLSANTVLSAGSTLVLTGSSSGTLTLAPATAVTSYTLVFPAAQGASSSVLTNDGSGNLSWSVPGTGDMLLAAVQTVTGAKTFNSAKFLLAGATSGTLTINAAATTTPYTILFPAAQGAASTFLQNDGAGNLSWATISGGGDMLLAGVQTVTGAKTFSSGKLLLAGSSSGTLTLNTSATTSSYTVTMPAAQGGSGQTLSNDGSGNLTWVTPGAGMAIGGTVTSGTVGSILFIGTGPILQQDSTNFFYDISSKQLEIALGTASLPAYSFIGDVNTGAYSPAADTYAITTGGTERVRVTSTGLFGIGVTPTIRLHASTGAAATTAISRMENSVGNFDTFFSTATPEAAITGGRGDITVVDDTSQGSLFIKRTGTGTAGWQRVDTALSITSKTTTYTVDANADSVINGDTTSAGFTITLPTPTANQRKNFYFKNTTLLTNILTVAIPSGHTLDGVTNGTLLLAAMEAKQVIFDGTTSWYTY